MSSTAQGLKANFVPFRDGSGREFTFAMIDNGATDWGVHFSAFFGDWGDRPEYRNVFKGYFHRLRMLGSYERLNWLFVCDPFGADRNGCYYWGEKGDPFVEEAIHEFTHTLPFRSQDYEGRVYTVGSSMGATGALKFGLQWSVDGIVALAPHIDLDTSARMQGRERHVAALTPDGDPYSTGNLAITRQIRALVPTCADTVKGLPRLFIQACADDLGVYPEQVEPFLELWRLHGGAAVLDLRSSGGHTSDWATRPLLIEVLDSWQSERALNVQALQSEATFLPVTPRYWRRAYVAARRLAGRLRAKLTRS